METKRKNRFWKGLLIYILVMLAVIAVGLAVFWQYMAAYEAARPEGTMDAWIETRSDDALSGGIARWAEEDFRSVNGQIEYLLTEAVRRRKKAPKSADLEPEESFPEEDS